jgi:hypothetical protein
MIDYEDEDFDITVDNNEIPSVDDVFTLEDWINANRSRVIRRLHNRIKKFN